MYHIQPVNEEKIYNNFRKHLYIPTGSFGKAKNYAVSADLKMTDLGKYSTSYGFLGIAFNMMDSKNYDIAYVRYFEINSGLTSLTLCSFT